MNTKIKGKNLQIQIIFKCEYCNENDKALFSNFCSTECEDKFLGMKPEAKSKNKSYNDFNYCWNSIRLNDYYQSLNYFIICLRASKCCKLKSRVSTSNLYLSENIFG